MRTVLVRKRRKKPSKPKLRSRIKALPSRIHRDMSKQENKTHCRGKKTYFFACVVSVFRDTLFSC